LNERGATGFQDRDREHKIIKLYRTGTLIIVVSELDRYGLASLTLQDGLE